MSENDTELQDAEVPVEQEDAVEPQSDQEDTEKSLEGEKEPDWKQIASDRKIRAEKAEKELKALKNAPKEEKKEERENYSLADIRALADVHDDDVSWLTGYAKFKGVSVADAKKLPEAQVYLKMKGEERTTAAAANTATQKRGARAPQTDYLAKIERSELKDKEEMKQAAKAYVESLKKGQA